MVLLRIEIERTRSKFASEDFDERQDLAEEFIPAGDLAEAGFLEVGGARGVVDAGLEDAQAASSLSELKI